MNIRCYFWTFGDNNQKKIWIKKILWLFRIGVSSRIGISVSVSVSAETKPIFRFRYRFRPKQKMTISASFGFGRKRKKPFGRTLSLEFSPSIALTFCNLSYLWVKSNLSVSVSNLSYLDYFSLISNLSYKKLVLYSDWTYFLWFSNSN